ncbi:hypothetical protein CEP53_008622 [Fusarium sp. AF-6]|nr:hypothetical protein CEP53_008622 [Fusarium sp. AF-6]
MSRTLKYNMLDIGHPGMLIDESHLKVDVLGAALYSCTSWVDHASDLIADTPLAEAEVYITKYLGEVYDFLRKAFTNYTSLSGLVTLSPAGDMVSYPSLNETVEVRDTASGRRIQALGRCHGLSALKFSLDGKTVALGFQNGTIRLWDIFTAGNLVLRASESAAPVCSLDFASDKKTLAVCFKNDSVEIWSIDTGQHQKTMAYKNCHAFSPYGTMFATLHHSGRVRITRLWPRDEKVLSTRFPGNLASAFSPDSRFLALASARGNVEIHNLEENTVRCYGREGEDLEIVALAFLDEDTLAFADRKTNQIGTLRFKSDEPSTSVVANAVVEEYPFEYLPFEKRVFEAANGEDKPPRFLMRGSRFVAMDWGYLLGQGSSTKIFSFKMNLSIIFTALLTGAVTAVPIFVDCENQADFDSATATRLRCTNNLSNANANANANPSDPEVHAY